MNSRHTLYLGVKSTVLEPRLRMLDGSVRGRFRLFSCLVISSLFLHFFNSLFSLSVTQAASLGFGGGAWCPKVPAKLEMLCCKELPHCDTLHTDLSFAADLKGERGERPDCCSWALMCSALCGDHICIKRNL